LQLTSGADLNRALNDIKGKIDAVTTFPTETEKPIVRAFSSSGNVMTMALASESDDRNLKAIAEEIRNDLIDLPGVSTVNIEYIRPLEDQLDHFEFPRQSLSNSGHQTQKLAP
jgi:multidrug efflux pump subunit AcrB